MRVLLTGASGFIGSYVLEALIGAGIDTVTVGRRTPHAEKTTNEHINFDLLQDQNVQLLLTKARATHLLHCAWYAEHGLFWTSPLNTRWVDASVRLIEAFCAHGGQRVVGVGTCAEYDWSHGYCQENHTALDAATLYGASKDASRRLSELICKEANVGFAWGRIFSPYGPGEDGRRLIPTLVKALRGEALPIGINANVYRDFMHVSDVAGGLLVLLDTERSGCFNLSSGQPMRLGDLALTLGELLKIDPTPLLKLSPKNLDRVTLLVGDNTKLRSLGWNARLSIRDGLAQTLLTMDHGSQAVCTPLARSMSK